MNKLTGRIQQRHTARSINRHRTFRSTIATTDGDEKMSKAILQWLGGNDTGASSEAVALTALGEMPKNPSYPSDASDFGRCHRLIKTAPEARKAIDYLGEHGGKIWKALAARWDEIDAAYTADSGCYELMKSIIHPIEDASGNVFRMGNGIAMIIGKGAR